MARKQRIASPLSVAARTKRMLESGRMKVEPVWYRPVVNTPPMADFSRKPAPAHQGRIRTKQTDIFELQQVARGPEQHYRRKFYKQHPWELARPRILVEEDGADHVRQDWSRIEQVGKQLDGERYVCPERTRGLRVVLCNERCI
jgi:small subunit ribosomal protein S23